MTAQSIIILLLVGLVAGWLAGLITKGSGFGLIIDMLIGVLGAFLGTWLLSSIGVFVSGILGLLIAAVIGAVVLLFVIGLIRVVTYHGRQ